MTFYSTHLKPHEEPVLIPETFAWGAFFFGPVWLAAYRAWIPAILSFAVGALIAALCTGATFAILIIGYVLILGLAGHDMRRWSLERRGYLMTHVLAGRDEIEAMRALLVQRPDLGDLYRPRPA